MKNIAYVYMDKVGNVCFQIGDFHIEYIASKQLTKIKSVLEYKDTGYVVIDTNYGEEFYDFQYTLEQKGLASNIDIESIMNSIEKWEVKTMSIDVNTVRDRAKLIVNNIAFGTARLGGANVLRAIDLNNPKYIADFAFDRGINGFTQVSSTFAEGKRKYEMLYLTERNREELVEMLKKCQNTQISR